MKNTFGGFLRMSPPIIMGGVLMFRSERMRRTGARSTASGTSSHMQSWADCITGTLESSFWKRQPMLGAMDLGIADDGERADHEQAAQIAIALLADTAESVLAPA